MNKGILVKRGKYVVVLLLTFIGYGSFALNATYTARTTGSTWNSAASWNRSGGTANSPDIPGATDDVIIPAGGVSMTISTAATCRNISIAKALNVNTIGTLSVVNAMTFTAGTSTFSNTTTGAVSAASVNFSGGSLTLPGALSVSGTLLITNGTLLVTNTTSGKLVATNFTMNGGSLSLGQTSSLNNVPFPTVSSATTLNGGTITIYAKTNYAINASVSYFNLVMQSATGATPTYTVASDLTVKGSLNVNGSAIFSPTSHTVNIGVNFTATSSKFSAGTSTVNFNGTGDQVVAGVDYYNLTIVNSSGIVKLSSGTVGILNVLTVDDNQAFTLLDKNGGTISYKGTIDQSIAVNFVYNNLIIANTGIGTKVSIPAGLTLQVAGNITANASFDALTNLSPVELVGYDASQTLSGGTYYDLIVSVTGTGASSVIIPSGASNTVTISNSMIVGDPGLSSFIDPNSNLIIADNASLLDYNPNGSSFAGNLVIQKKATAASARSFFLSSPIQAATTADLQTGAYNPLYYNSDGFPGDYARITSACLRNPVNGNSQRGSAQGLYKVASGSLTLGRGYSLKQDAGVKTLSFVGLPNYDQVDFSSYANDLTDRTATPYNWCPDQNHLQLLGNPYPCAIDWALVYANCNNSLSTHAKIYNGVNYTDLQSDIESPISTAQAFFVQVVDPGNVPADAFNQSTWIGNNLYNGSLLRKETKQRVGTVLSLSDKVNEEYTDKLIVILNENAKDEIELRYDAVDWPGISEVPSLTALQQGGEYSALQFPTPTKEKKIPLVLNTPKNGVYELRTDSTTILPAGLELVLVDKFAKKETIVYPGIKVDLTLKAGYNPNQYELQFRSESFDKSATSANGSFAVIENSGSLIVTYSEVFNEGNISVYDLQGRLVDQKAGVQSGSKTYEFSGLKPSSCYIVRLLTDNGIKTQKVILK